MRLWWNFAAVVVVGLVVGGGYGFPEEDLVTKLPGQPVVKFRQYAGYVDVDVKNGRSLFYYFVEAADDPDRKPLTLWLNGGPGCSSVGGGAFTELGPFYPTGDGRGLRINSKSWNKASNLLFVESPAGVGWSYSNTSSDYNCGDASTAMDMHMFLMEWYKKFPTLKTRDLFLTGESYAGHYIPQLAVALLDHNEHSTEFKFKIKGVAIGNPLLRLDRDVPATYEFFWSHGMISDEIGLTIMNDCDFDDYTFASPHKCVAILLQRLVWSGRLHELGGASTSTFLRFRRLYMQTGPIYHIAGLCAVGKKVLNYNETDGNIDILPLLKRIIQNRIPVWIFSGDQDSVVPLLGSRTLVRELAHDLLFKITVPYGAWFHKGQVGGWATEYGNLLTFATLEVRLIWCHMRSRPGLCICSARLFVAGDCQTIHARPSTTDDQPTQHPHKSLRLVFVFESIHIPHFLELLYSRRRQLHFLAV
ncbi:UNVERIFIED_CONTAM: Serine carboxypeptidase-like 42 [Sesamum radiatum]|uniref:Carboxypeptidase n=1 Tax=Sesamum radiatum TaxID=300843 RepID=A0AAW2M6H2_SESRA